MLETVLLEAVGEPTRPSTSLYVKCGVLEAVNGLEVALDGVVGFVFVVVHSGVPANHRSCRWNLVDVGGDGLVWGCAWNVVLLFAKAIAL